MSRLARYLGVFVFVVVLVLAAAAVGPAVLGSSSGTSVSGQSPAQYQPSNLRLDTVEETGSITVDGPDETKTVAIDLTHGNRITRDQLTPLVSALVEAGHEVHFVGGESSMSMGRASGFNATLRNVDAYVVAAPNRPVTATQLRGLKAYAEGDGRVLVLEDTPRSGVAGSGTVVSYGRDGVASQAARLGSTFGVSFGTSYLYDMADSDTNFKAVRATPVESGGLLDGVDTVVFREPVPVRISDDATPLLQTADTAALESTRKQGAYTVLARSGNVVAVGDTTFLSPGSHREADNEVLIGNLATFLVSGEKAPNVPSAGSSDGGLFGGMEAPADDSKPTMTETPSNGTATADE
ncbi:MAG: hypothetical protein ABEI98_11445 [Halorhabdus sp.]